jgi:hypothetical protein
MSLRDMLNELGAGLTTFEEVRKWVADNHGELHTAPPPSGSWDAIYSDKQPDDNDTYWIGVFSNTLSVAQQGLLRAEIR